MTASARVNNKNDDSPQSCRECPVLDHSTPVRQKHSLNKAEESPDVDYCSISMLLPCTQEGGNEVAWDWQSPLNKTPDSRPKKQSVQCETPKGTKLLHRKRNSNSPLLHKPLKRKLNKMENIENMGQFAAELQALNERMRIIRQSKKQGDHPNDCIEEDAPSTVNMSNAEEISRAKDNGQDGVGRTSDCISASEARTNYDDLFDDSIDDSMAKCTQEIEEKFNLIAVKGDPNVCSQAGIEREQSFPTDNTADNACPVQSTNKISQETTAKDPSYKVTSNNNNKINTYSKLSSRRDADSSIHAASWKNKDLRKSCLNNNDTVHCRIEKPCDTKTTSKNNATELFDIPDDSFDDCLATCIEDEKLLSMSMEFDESLLRRNDDVKHYKANYKYLTHAPLKGRLFCDDVTSELKPANLLNTTTKVEVCTTGLLENRKFFKTKSLSDQYIGQNAITNSKNTVNAAAQSTSCYTAKPTRLNSLPRSSTVSYTSVTRVSTNSIATNNHRKIEDNAISLMRGAARTHGSDVNRSVVKESGDRFTRHNSTGNMKDNTKETSRITSQPTRCTAEEIEKKRLQAKMRLEARRKLYSTNLANNINR